MCTYDMFYNDLGEVTEVIAIVTAIKRELLTQKSPQDIPLCGDIRNRKLTYWRVETSTCQMNEAETLTAFFVGSNSSYFFCFLKLRHSLSALQFSGVIFIICYCTLSQCTYLYNLRRQKFRLLRLTQQRLNDGAQIYNQHIFHSLSHSLYQHYSTVLQSP